MVVDSGAAAPFPSEVERVTGLLRDAIVDGSRAPGSKLVERDLAQQMGVSRVPVREALRNLVAEGLATARPRTWTVVREFTDAEVEDLMEVRSVLETLAVRLAAQRCLGTDLQRLADLVEHARRAAAGGDGAAARRAGADFHEALVEASGNSVLVEFAELTRSRMRWLLGQHEDLMEMVLEHSALTRAIGERDVERAVRLAERHLQSSRRALARRRGG